MSTDQEHELALIMAPHHRIDPMTSRDRCTCGHKTPLGHLFTAHIAAEVLAAVHPTITTAGELDALGTGAIVADFGINGSYLHAPVIACKTGRGDWQTMGANRDRRWRSYEMITGANGAPLTVLSGGKK